MAGSGKVLTIIYGNFTCTLEGFDDPLQVMTSILDYLRELEATGPAVARRAPDRDILIGIAAGGAALEVDADERAGAIHLRPVPARAPPPDTAPADPGTPLPTDPQDEMSRIFAETDMQLETPASSRHRNAIQHARAALAATRVTASEGFASFVARRGVSGLPDLVEAAAAYITDIEGRARISPQMLMEKLDEIGGPAARDDVPQACAALLEAGKLRACLDGGYAITATTAFRATQQHPN